MKIVSVNQELLDALSVDGEMLRKAGRPCVLIIKLKYKGKKRDFAVPLRSNIKSNAPKDQYFPLPTRSTTQINNRHGVHYIKMFPVDKKYLLKYRTEGNDFAELINRVIEDNKKRIIFDCQKYLNDYEDGIKPKFSTDIDLLISELDKIAND